MKPLVASEINIAIPCTNTRQWLQILGQCHIGAKEHPPHRLGSTLSVQGHLPSRSEKPRTPLFNIRELLKCHAQLIETQNSCFILIWMFKKREKEALYSTHGNSGIVRRKSTANMTRDGVLTCGCCSGGHFCFAAHLKVSLDLNWWNGFVTTTTRVHLHSRNTGSCIIS